MSKPDVTQAALLLAEAVERWERAEGVDDGWVAEVIPLIDAYRAAREAGTVDDGPAISCPQCSGEAAFIDCHDCGEEFHNTGASADRLAAREQTKAAPVEAPTREAELEWVLEQIRDYRVQPRGALKSPYVNALASVQEQARAALRRKP